MIEVRDKTHAQFKLKVGKAKSGLGLFALEPIPKGKKIIEYVGRVLTDEPDDALDNLYIFRVNKHMDIDGSPRFNTARYINHACRPNAESEVRKGHVWIIAKRNIALGEEITYDYGKEYWREYIQPKGCRCPKCTSARAATSHVPALKVATKHKSSKGVVLASPEYLAVR
jgi:SET domain-containing protein